MLVFASQKIVHNVRDVMAESIVALKKKIKDSLTRQGMWNIEEASIENDWRDGKKKKEYSLLREHTNKS